MMKVFKAYQYKLWLLMPILAMAMVLGANPSAEGALLFKDYVVRYDRGWDILCDPYRINKDDWVLKIFRQKGEIAHNDFQEFLGIFKRLNPHIKDIDRIRPGQVVDIPLKKLNQGTLPGQASGVVTIPFVTLTKTAELIARHSKTYTIKRGDTISELIASRFGNFGTQSYSEAVKLLKSVNPGIKNIDKIYAGQKIYMPDPSIREENWYASLFDDTGNVKKEIGKTKSPVENSPPQPRPEPQKTTPSDAPIAEAASVMGGKLLNRGTYYLPMKNKEAFELDLSQYPVIELPEGDKVILTRENRIMNVDMPLLQSYWNDVKIVKIPKTPSASQVLSSVFAAYADEGKDNSLSFTGEGVEISIRAKWIKRDMNNPDSEIRNVCITPISNRSQKTSDFIVRYLDMNGIVINEVFPSKKAPLNQDNQQKSFRITEPVVLKSKTQKELVENLSAFFKFNYAKNVSISFPYAGIQVKALSNLISFEPGKETLIDFGDLYGDAIEAIKKTGLNIVKISIEDNALVVVKKLMQAAGSNVIENPVFLGAERPEDFNTSIRFQGLLLDHAEKGRLLFLKQPIDGLLVHFLSSKKIRIVNL